MVYDLVQNVKTLEHKIPVKSKPFMTDEKCFQILSLTKTEHIFFSEKLKTFFYWRFCEASLDFLNPWQNIFLKKAKTHEDAQWIYSKGTVKTLNNVAGAILEILKKAWNKAAHFCYLYNVALKDISVG